MMDCFLAGLLAQSVDRLWSSADYLCFLDVEIENLVVAFEDAATCDLADAPPQTQMGDELYLLREGLVCLLGGLGL